MIEAHMYTGGDQATMATISQYNIGCGVFTAKIVGDDVPEAPPAKCLNSKVRAPKGLQGSGVGDAVRQFCKDNNGKSLEHHEVYRVIGQRKVQPRMYQEGYHLRVCMSNKV